MREEEKKTMKPVGAAKRREGEERDFVGEVARLLEQYPELKGKTLPEEVVLAAMDGEDLIAAYEEYLEEQGLAEMDDAEDKESLPAKKRSGVKNAPVRGVSGGSAVTVQGEDDFLRGLNAE